MLLWFHSRPRSMCNILQHLHGDLVINIANNMEFTKYLTKVPFNKKVKVRINTVRWGEWGCWKSRSMLLIHVLNYSEQGADQSGWKGKVYWTKRNKIHLSLHGHLAAKTPWNMPPIIESEGKIERKLNWAFHGSPSKYFNTKNKHW